MKYYFEWEGVTKVAKLLSLVDNKAILIDYNDQFYTVDYDKLTLVK